MYTLILFYLQLAQEKEESEREKWEILQRARETSERCMEFKTEVDLKSQQIKKLEIELAEVRDAEKDSEI